MNLGHQAAADQPGLPPATSAPRADKETLALRSVVAEEALHRRRGAGELIHALGVNARELDARAEAVAVERHLLSVSLLDDAAKKCVHARATRA